MQRKKFRKFDFIRRNRKRKGLINFTLPKRSDAKKKRNVATHLAIADSVNGIAVMTVMVGVSGR